MENTAAVKVFSKDWFRTHGAALAGYGGVLFCIVFFSITTPLFGESIWSASKLSTLISDVIVLAILSVGAVFVYSLGSMDISIGKQVGLYATIIVAVTNSTGSLILGILICLVIAVFIGIVNGATGELLHIHSVVSSLVFMMVLGGISTLIYNNMGSRNVALKSFDHHIFKNVWLMVIVLVVEVLIVTFLFNYTKFGKNARAIGANPVAAEQSGINLVKYKVIAYVIMGVFVVVAAIFQMGYTGSASDSTGTGFEMNVMVALILGGMPLSGGMKSRVSCAVLGSFTFSLLNVGLPMIGIPVNTVNLIKAIIFIIVVLITCRKSRGVLPR
ncbi:MAG: ABC transporter permease [Parasporobacterium sp.]|nr:ABC transporter permease [Parasporobacterium sp.]